MSPQSALPSCLQREGHRGQVFVSLHQADAAPGWPLSIVFRHPSRSPSARRSDRPKRRTVALRASVGSTEAPGSNFSARCVLYICHPRPVNGYDSSINVFISRPGGPAPRTTSSSPGSADGNPPPPRSPLDRRRRHDYPLVQLEREDPPGEPQMNRCTYQPSFDSAALAERPRAGRRSIH
jgi:hypothetical protein